MSKQFQRVTHVNSQTGELVEADVDLSDRTQQLVASATAQGIELTGPNGLLTGLTRQVLQSARGGVSGNPFTPPRVVHYGAGSKPPSTCM